MILRFLLSRLLGGRIARSDLQDSVFVFYAAKVLKIFDI